MIAGIHADPINHRIPGGVGVYVRRLVEHLPGTMGGDDLRLLTVKPAPDDLNEWWKPRRAPAGLPLKLLYASWNYLQVPNLDDGLDVVHATGLVIPPARGARLVATIHDLTVVRMPHLVPSPWRQIYRRGLKVALERATLIITVTNAIKDELIDSFSVEPERIAVTPQAPNQTPADYRDEEWFEKLRLKGPFILNVGTLEPRKNQTTLLQAFARAGGDLDGVQLVLAGAAGWAADSIFKTIKELDLTGRVTVTGQIGASELASLFARARVFAMPSLYEGFGLPLLEALSFGIPAAASNDPALKEIAGPAALFTDALDVDGWANALITLTTDEDQRKSLSDASAERVKKFDWNQTAQLTVEAYRKAAAA